MPTYEKILKVNEKYALDNEKEPSAIKRLLMYHAAFSSTEYYQRKTEIMDDISYQNFLKDVDVYIKKSVPVQHLIGSETFFGYEFMVNEHVLIPRYETEELVFNVLEYIDSFFNQKDLILADIGTGSGCIGLTLKKENPNLTVFASDISLKALDVARQNADILNVDVTFKEGDMAKPFVDNHIFDVVVSNPPYLKIDEPLEKIVIDYDPKEALFGGKDGLVFYKRLFEDAPKIIKQKALIALEHGDDLAKPIKKIIKKTFPNARVVQKKDMQGKDRMTFVFIEPDPK